jgi:hypothetical protein
MKDSHFWQDLENLFRQLDSRGPLRADWHYIAGTGGRGDWRLEGANHEEELSFKLLAGRGGAALDESGKDTLTVWFDALKSKSPNFQINDHYPVGQNEDGSRAVHVTGRIERVCQASANLCLAFQIEAEKPPKPERTCDTRPKAEEGVPVQAAKRSGLLSPRDLRIHDAVDGERFLTLTNGEIMKEPGKKRGRKRRFSSDQLQRANKMKRAGKLNNEIAKVLYETPNPTPAQRRSVPTILNHHFRPKK